MYFPLWKFLEVDHDCNDAAEGPVLHIRNTGIIWACVRIAELGSSITSELFENLFLITTGPRSFKGLSHRRKDARSSLPSSCFHSHRTTAVRSHHASNPSYLHHDTKNENMSRYASNVQPKLPIPPMTILTAARLTCASIQSRQSQRGMLTRSGGTV
ncbi:uncharacterized protein LOC111244975 isoform X2 [Varroa destructor]|uniref:Uncharacterized protein n=1 Tax=Varroa destructor TaxID=109461 RepID=A0A7M7J8M5_VARDE|nr:uncharacterized protein LOC111244975 isoform X2 [Varroa destructor]